MEMQLPKEEIVEKAKTVRLLFLDVDGVLTDGGKYYSSDGKQMKKFNTHDGFGIEIWQNSGFEICIVTHDKTGIVNQRAKNLKIQMVYTGVRDKLPIIVEVMESKDIKKEEIAYIGDDLLDMEVMKKVGLAVAVPNATEEIIKIAHCVTSNKGGEGAVRELIDFILKTKSVVPKW